MNKDGIGDATLLGHLVLGRLALLHDDVEEAEKHLLLSAQIQNGHVTFWGPNMTLAPELLRRNRSKSVLQFLEAPKLFWRVDCAGPETADKWAAEIREGKMPEFYANLVY